MYEIDISSLNAVHKGRLGVIELVPAHARYFVFMTLWLEPLYLCIENTNTVDITFF
jgi:hypothetical protein